ncbi:MAG: hypothetical protein HWE22_11535 [Flavobacteriales bacterium]|nr:hypothetical protein [Flavobacteriales bacterium]
MSKIGERINDTNHQKDHTDNNANGGTIEIKKCDSNQRGKHDKQKLIAIFTIFLLNNSIQKKTHPLMEVS